MSCQTTAFGKDLISLPKLLELVLFPFLRIARKFNEDTANGLPDTEAVKAQRRLRDAMLVGWTEGLINFLDGDITVEGVPGKAPVVASLTSASQQAEIEKALLDIGIFKVSIEKRHLYL